MKNNQEIPIFFTVDEKYIPYLSVAISSIIKNSSKEYNYKVIVLYQDVNNKSMEKILQMQTDNFKIKFIYMKEGLETITDRIENRLRCDYFTLTIYFRLFIADMFPEYDKGIYIDSDIVVPGDIAELYNIDLKDNLIGASIDHSIQDVEPLVYYVENAVGVNRKEYINSGVLLMNLKLMRDKKFSEKFLKLLNTYHFESIAPDQDYINAMCNGKILYLDECWDAMPIETKKELANPKLIHYNLFAKPWCYDNIQYEKYFWNYAKDNAFYKNIIEFKNNYSNEQKQSDTDCLNLLIHKGTEIPNNEITFKNIFDNGENIRI